MADEEFEKVGKQPGLVVWRIDSFKLVRIPKHQYGTFFGGDSYLIINTRGSNHGKLEWDIHFWLGSNSTLDEMATAAIKAVELDDHLGGRPVQYREMQYFESKLFKSYFLNGIRYLQGGIASGFKSIDNLQHAKRLYMVKGKRNIRIVEVPLRSESLNKSDVFILENGENIYQWCPPGSNRIERLRANTYAKQIRDDEYGGKATVHLIEDDWETNQDFWDFFDQKSDKIKDNSDVEDIDFERKFIDENIQLYRVSDLKSNNPTIVKVATGPLKKSMLDSNDCFIVDCAENGIYTWIGKRCTKNEKIASIMAAKELMVKNNHARYIPMSQLIDGGETTTFKSLFNDWN
ncbi:Gelsolin 1 [Brachionus plicatilis]|uniref:Gelsolin 1 n=1 Tax=Brachionus plicatilis TaxID=10195 RepID=A0A3M7S3K1_BRAPC|nr:Gelsolin 1 [Brachionus plicatilis]